MRLYERGILKTAHLINRLDGILANQTLTANRTHEKAAGAKGELVAGRYRLESLLGEGGMGKVWLVEDTVAKQQLALKQMKAVKGPPSPAEREALNVAFSREFYSMTKLQHPNTVRVFDYGVLPRGDTFITMELVKGADLKNVLKRGPLDLRRVYSILSELARVLGFIHSRLFVHCDIKSENVRIAERNTVKLMDFGLMHQLGTPAGALLKGTPYYMAPEVPKGGILDARTDLYSLGVLAFELATGRYPFIGRTLTEILSQHQEKPPPRMKPLRDIPDAFEQIVAKLLSKQPRDRYPDTSAFIKDLAALSGQAIEVEDYGARTSYLHSSELIGREAEQKALRGALDALLAKKGRSVFVTAPAGVGKTRLIQEFRLSAKLANVPFLIGQCRAEGQEPLGPLAQALEQLIPLSTEASLKSHGPVLIRILPQLATRGIVPAPRADPNTEKVQMLAAIGAWLKELSAVQPFILCLEDLHWADASTIEFMNAVVRSLAEQGAMVLGTWRSNEVDRFSLLFQTLDEQIAVRIDLPNLSLDDTMTLVGTTLMGFQTPADFVQKLYDATGGNAFFVSETLRALIEQRVLSLQGGRWELTNPTAQLPRTTEEVVVGRLSSLAPETLLLCRQLAPLGRLVELRVVKNISSVSDEALFARLDELVERQFMQRIEKDYYFSHDAVRMGVYNATPIDERRGHHLRIAEAIERIHAKNLDGVAAQLAYHFSRAGDRDRAIKYLLSAATRSLSNNILFEGIKLLSEAADLIESGNYPDKDRKLLELWAKLVEVGFVANPLLCVKYADKLVPTLEGRVGGADNIKRFHFEARRLEQRPKFLSRRKLGEIWADHPFEPRRNDLFHVVPKLFVYRNLQAFACGLLGQGPRAASLLEKQLQDNPDPGAFRAAAQASKSVGLFHMGLWAPQQHEARQAMEWFEHHLETIGRMPTRLFWFFVAAHYWTAAGATRMGKPLEPGLMKSAFRIADQHGFGDWKFLLGMIVLMRAGITGDPVEMQKTHGNLTDTIRRLGNPRLLEGRLAGVLPEYYLQRGEKEYAEAAISKLEKIVNATNQSEIWNVRYLLTFKALYLTAHGDRDQAQSAVKEAIAAAKQVPNFSRLAQLLIAQARLDWAAGRTDQAKDFAAQALTRATVGPTANPLDETVARRAVGELSGDVTQVQKAIDVAQANGLSIDEAQAQLVLARMLIKVDRSGAARALDEAEAKLQALSCSELLKQVQAFRRTAAGVA